MTNKGNLGTGKLINTDDERNLKLFDGKIINVNNEKITSFDFKTTNFDLGKYLTKSITDFKIQERKTSDILNCYINYFILGNQSYYETTKCNDPAIKEMQKELFNRLIKPLFIPILTLSLCFLLIIPKENQRYKSLSMNSFLNFFDFSRSFSLIAALMDGAILFVTSLDQSRTWSMIRAFNSLSS